MVKDGMRKILLLYTACVVTCKGKESISQRVKKEKDKLPTSW